MNGRSQFLRHLKFLLSRYFFQTSVESLFVFEAYRTAIVAAEKQTRNPNDCFALLHYSLFDLSTAFSVASKVHVVPLEISEFCSSRHVKPDDARSHSHILLSGPD